MLDAGNDRLTAAGYASRSGFLNSPTAGGGSWLAHATFLSGLWINGEQRYRNLVSSDRLTLTGAFQRAEWDTVAVMPNVVRAWPEASFYGYDQVLRATTTSATRARSSAGPECRTSTRLRPSSGASGRGAGRAPLMAEIAARLQPRAVGAVPRMIDWNDVEDGSEFAPMATEGEPVDEIWQSRTRVRNEYRRSIEYSLNTVISYVETYGDDDLVMVFLGDHQPAPVVTGEGANRDVPITIVTRDQPVLDKISGWGWDEGLKPGPKAPVWPMNEFRDRFLTTFGSTPQPH